MVLFTIQCAILYCSSPVSKVIPLLCATHLVLCHDTGFSMTQRSSLSCIIVWLGDLRCHGEGGHADHAGPGVDLCWNATFALASTSAETYPILVEPSQRLSLRTLHTVQPHLNAASHLLEFALMHSRYRLGRSHSDFKRHSRVGLRACERGCVLVSAK